MGLFDWMKRKGDGGPSAPLDDAFAASHARLDAYWAAVGEVEHDVLAPLINPAFRGGPAWPGRRQAYRVIRRPGSTILATDGLSDPFVDGGGKENGFGVELFIETSDIPTEFVGTEGDLARINESWAFTLLLQVAELVAESGGFGDSLERLGVISTEFPGASNEPTMTQLPGGYVTSDDSLGLLIGGPAPDFPTLIPDMPLSPVRIVPLVLVRADELEALRDGGGAARREIVERLSAGPSRHRCDLHRASVA